MEGAYYSITFHLLSGVLTNDEIVIVRDHLVSGHFKFYSLVAAQVMPNHVLLILQPTVGYGLVRIMKGIKGVTAKLINQGREDTGSLWLEEYYDRIIRSPKELDKQLKYIYENPLRAGLTEDPSDYPGWWQNNE